MVARFPDGFLWGASTAAYQVEGGIENTDWAAAAREGKVPAAGLACDFYHKYEEDFDIAKSLGHNAQRVALEWARIEPREGEYDEKEIEHYRQMIRALKRRNMVPFVNMWHFTLPEWFAQKGGFLEKGAPDTFARFCAYVIEKLGDEADFWITLNEPMVYASKGYMQGQWPPFQKSPFHYRRVINALIASHCRAYRAMKKIKPSLQIGIAKHNIFFESNWNPINIVLASYADWFWNHRFVKAIEGHQDIIGLNHYFWVKYGVTKEEKDRYPFSDFGWSLHPTSLLECLRALKRYKVPIYVTEHGLSDAKDRYRTAFIKHAAVSLYRAIHDGVDVRGYFHWSLLDNYEWAAGYTQRFGLVEVDFVSRTRTVRPSARYFETICKSNEIDGDMLLDAHRI